MKSWNIAPSEECTRGKNAIRAFIETEVSKIKPNPEKTRLNMTLGDPAAYPEFRISSDVCDLLESDFKNTITYADNLGPLESREYVAKLYSTEDWKLTSDDVFLTMGGSAALSYLFNVLANPGDTILAPHPGFPLIFAMTANRGVNCVCYKLENTNDAEIDLTDLEAKVKEHKPKFILVNNPSNPLGTVWSEDHIKAVLALADKHKVPIISDEMYEKMVYPGRKACSFGNLSKGQPVFVFSGLSKMCLAPGWRTGWVVCFGKQELIKDVKHGLKTMCAIYNHPNKIAALKIESVFENSFKVMKDKMDDVDKKAALIKSKLSSIDGVKLANAQGALYLTVFLDFSKLNFEDDKKLTLKLLEEENIFVLPGDAFKASSMIRLVLMCSNSDIDEFVDRFYSFL